MRIVFFCIETKEINFIHHQLHVVPNKKGKNITMQYTTRPGTITTEAHHHTKSLYNQIKVQMDCMLL